MPSVVKPSVVKLTVAASKRGNLSKKSPMKYDSNVSGINRFYAALMDTFFSSRHTKRYISAPNPKIEGFNRHNDNTYNDY